MIQVEKLTKVYHLSKKQMKQKKAHKKEKVAVNNISFEVSAGEIFGLLGPNGAGKTTTLRTMATLLKPTSGQVSIQGFDVVEEGQEVRKHIGFLTNELKMEGHFTPSYTMDFFGRLHDMDKALISQRKKELFEVFGVDAFENRKISELSTGMTQKLAIAVSLIHDPEVIIFDEPTNGLDIITAKSVTDYLLKLKESGKLIVVSTHIMAVAERLCDRIGIIIDGKMVGYGKTEAIILQENAADLEEAFFRLYETHKEAE